MIARFADQTIITAAAAVSALFALGGAVSFFLDRRRKADGWFALLASGLAIWHWSALAAVNSRFSGLAPLLVSPWICVAEMGSARSYFRLRPPLISQLGVITLGLASLVFGRAPISRSLLALVGSQFALVMLLEAAILGRLIRRPAQRSEALCMFGTWQPLAISAARHIVGQEPFHFGTLSVASMILLVSRGGLLLRRHARELGALKVALKDRLAAVTERTRDVNRLNQALRLQIQGRSVDLARALGQIGRLSNLKNRSLTVGTMIGERYTIVRQIGEGGMAAVYEVQRTSDHKRFALKTLLTAHSGTWLARLAREAQAVATIVHPNVVTIVDLDVDTSGMPFLVMELVDGESLAAKKGRFGDPIFAREVVRQVAEGLAALHAAGIVHRDLTPANVLIQPQPCGRFRAKIVDLGIARVSAVEVETTTVDPAPQSGSGSLTRTGWLMGTPLYMAPELANGVKNASSSCDLWSLGVVAYQIGCGTLPFLDSPLHWSRDGRSKVPAIDTCHLAEPLRAVVEHCLKVDPVERPTASEVAAALS